MDIARRLARAGKGSLHGQLRLNGEVALADGRSSSTSLCLTSTGLYLVLLRADEDDEDVLDLLGSNRHLRYRSQLLGDRLEIDRWVLSVPWGRGEQARELIGLARLRRSFGEGPMREADEAELRLARASLDDSEGPWSWSGPFIDDLGALQRAWLLRWLDPDERLLAWKASDERRRFDSPILVGADAATCLVITDRRQGLVALSSVGDRWSATLADEALELVSSTVGRSLLRADGHELRVPLGEERLFTELAQLPGLGPLARRRSVARALWLRQRGGAELTRAAAILDELASVDPLARLTRVLLVDPLGAPARARPLLALVAGDSAPMIEPGDSAAALVLAEDGGAKLPDPVFEALRELVDRAGAETPEELVAWWRSWELGPELGEVLVGHLCELGTRGLEVALPLHEQLRPILQAKLTDDPTDAALLDFVLAEHLLALGHAREALALLDERRRQLPSEQLQDLLPPSPERGGQQIRIELYELAASAHALLDDDHAGALAELARLQPLVVERLDALIEKLAGSAPNPGARADLLERAQQVRDLLDDDGFAPPPALPAGTGEGAVLELSATVDDGPPTHPRVRPLDPEQIELLRHPAARVDGVLGRLQETLAKVAVPDCSVLKSYCERANLARDAALARALTDATVILGLGGVEVFISRGDKAVGLRAYEGDSSFLLVGGDHVKGTSDAFLDEGPLRFAVAAELAHLRYSHARVTSDEVWAGTVDLGLSGLGMLIAAAPLLKGLKAPAKHLLDKVGAPAIKRWRQKLAGRDAYSLANDNSQVIAAHRAMQLSADRAGLLVCGDPRAAIRSMFTVHPAYLSMWPLVGSHGLRTTVTRAIRDDDERERKRLEDLAVRVAALLSFYLSDEYATLRAAVTDRS